MLKKIALVCSILLLGGCAHSFFGAKTLTEPILRLNGQAVCAMAYGFELEKITNKPRNCVCAVNPNASAELIRMSRVPFNILFVAPDPMCNGKISDDQLNEME